MSCPTSKGGWQTPYPVSLFLKVPVAPMEAGCSVRGIGERVQIVGTASWVAVLPTQFVESHSQVQTSENMTPQRVTHEPPIARPNYIFVWWWGGGTTQLVQHQSCGRQRLHALTSPSWHSTFQQPKWPPKIFRWYGSEEWLILSSASKVNCSNTTTWLPILRHRPHGLTIMATSLDGLHKEWQAKWREQTWSSLSPRAGYQGQGQRTSRTASSLD